MEVHHLQFLDMIWGQSEGFVSINTRSDDGSLDTERWFTIPADTSFIDKYIGLRADEDVYLSVSIFSAESRTNADPFAKANVVWADADVCDPANFRLPPSIIVQTSPACADSTTCSAAVRSGTTCNGHWHCWWVLDAEVPARDAETAARAIARAHQAQGCDRGWNLSRILRVPGTTNTKASVPFTVTAEYTGAVYTLESILDAYSDIDTESGYVDVPADIPELITGDALTALEDKYIAGQEWEDLYVLVPPVGESWWPRLFRLETDLVRAGATPEEIYSLAANSQCNKFSRDSRNPRDLWQTVHKAFREVETPVERDYAEPTPFVGDVGFLTADERELVTDNPGFIDRYTEWAMSKSPDSAPQYHRTFAFMVLSTAFSDRVFASFRWGLVYPNLWSLHLGDTTRTRKSTAKNFYISTIRALENLEGDKFDIGNNVTIEGLIQELGPRDGQVSVVWTDEVAKFFREAYGKQYQAGVIEGFTELYDGTVPVSIRATKGSGNKKRSTSRFLFVGVGIREAVAKILTKEDFESGFLARFVWAVADPKPYTPGSSDLEQQAPNDDGKFDSAQIEMVQDLSDRRYKFPQPTLLMYEPDALARLNSFVDQMHAAIASQGVANAGVDRLRDSVAKAALLLAAYNQEESVSLFDVLVAIHQGEFWFRDMMRMLGEVSNSDFGRRRDEVLTFIASGKEHRRAEADIWKKFQFKPTEFNEIITALQKSGDVRYVPNDRQRLEALV